MMDSPKAAAIARNLNEVREAMADACRRAGRGTDAATLVAITKYVGTEEIGILRDLGVTDVGENRIHVAQPKIEELGRALTWHMIGPIQRRKARDVAALFDWADAIDRAEVAVELDKRVAAAGREPMPVLLEVNISGEASKHGYGLAELPAALDAMAELAHIDVRGLMTMAPVCDDPEKARPIFAALREAADAYNLPVRSMGMTMDFPVAIEEGATHVRIGSALFHGLEGSHS